MRISKPEQRWFPVPEDKDGASVQVKHLRPGEVQEIIDEVMVQEIEYDMTDGGNRKPILRQKNNRKKDREKTILASVSDWKKFYDADGKAMACNEENILRAIKEIDGFVEFVAECRNKLIEDIASETAAQKKI